MVCSLHRWTRLISGDKYVRAINMYCMLALAGFVFVAYVLNKAPAKRSQHVNATYCIIAGCNMLRAFGHGVAMCYNMLGVVGSSLKLVKFEPTTPNMSQHVETRWPNARNMLRPTML